MCGLHIPFNSVELRALLVDHVRDIAEQFVELADGLLDVANLGLSLDDQLLLEVDIVLRCQAQLLLLLLLAEAASLFSRRRLVLERCPCSRV